LEIVRGAITPPPPFTEILQAIKRQKYNGEEETCHLLAYFDE